MVWKNKNAEDTERAYYPLLNLPVYAVLPLRVEWSVEMRKQGDLVLFYVREKQLLGQNFDGEVRITPWEPTRKVRDQFFSIREPQDAVSFLEKFGPWLNVAGDNDAAAFLRIDLKQKRILERLTQPSELSKSNAQLNWNEIMESKALFEQEALDTESAVGARPLDIRLQLPTALADAPVEFTARRAEEIFRAAGRKIPPIKSESPDAVLLEIWKEIQDLADADAETGSRVISALFEPRNAKALLSRLENKISNTNRGSAERRKLLEEHRAATETYERERRRASLFASRVRLKMFPWQNLNEPGPVPDDLRCPVAFIGCRSAGDAIRTDLILNRIMESQWHRCSLASCGKMYTVDSNKGSKFCCPEHYASHWKSKFIRGRAERNRAAKLTLEGRGGLETAKKKPAAEKKKGKKA